MASIRGGEKFLKAMHDLAKAVNRPESLRVGFINKATYPDGTSVALVATVQEFGSPKNKIPPRPYFRNMVADKGPEWPKAIAGLLKATKYDIPKTLALTGEAIKGQLQQSIRDTNAPPLKPGTIRAKGSDKPLIATGQMLSSISYEVKLK